MKHDIDNEHSPLEMGTVFDLQDPAYLREPRHRIPRRRRRRAAEAQETSERSGKNGRSRDAISAAADGSDGSEYLLKLRRHESLCMRIVLTLPRARWYDRFYKAVRTRRRDDFFCNTTSTSESAPDWRSAPTECDYVLSWILQIVKRAFNQPFYNRANCFKPEKTDRNMTIVRKNFSSNRFIWCILMFSLGADLVEHLL